ncbi:hypothetical protein TNIN_148401 [Trichonephila inaurata madagascariensis]|uniref:Uncharacterized protein n=1 Tax=Trichonephila inaurata madagascariensis TaxID=2747483 RepID=A0A8X6MBH5_9ARAC|nr:hypothetical protein TNIN_148401 [Trichonephila inaurata madagascariensis]
MKLLLRRISEANFATMDPTRKANLRDRKGIRYFLKRNKESSQEESSNKETQRRMKSKSSRFCEVKLIDSARENNLFVIRRGGQTVLPLPPNISLIDAAS